ncbi:MAG: hypothetical protein QOJ60_1027 [Actinomycetota bacterium]|nr:hypothetical protein [Actinomycetota bacterium]
MSATQAWPALPLAEWRATRDTLQLWLQIIGKVRMSSTPLTNHWWNVPLYVTARGLTTSLMRHQGGEGFEIDLDLREHMLHITTVSGPRRSMPLRAGPVSEFFSELMSHLHALGLDTPVWSMPVEIPDAIPFTDDDQHTAYEPAQAEHFWLALTRIVPVFERFRSGFIGKASPVHLFWGGLDLATTRFSGRIAPPHHGGAPNCGPHVMLEAYSHEVSSCGYWPGGAGEGMFYSYAYPTPPGYADSPVQPSEASWSEGLGEFVLPYEVVRTAANPVETLMTFLNSTYEATATTANWDRKRLER